MSRDWFNLRSGLILLAGGLVLALGFESDWGPRLVSPSPMARAVTGKHDTLSVLPDFRLGSDAGTYAQIVDRPLLNPARRPAPLQAVAVAQEPPKPQFRRGLYQLVGVTDLGTIRIAQVRELSSNRISSVREGDSLQEFTVQKVGSDQLVLAFQDESETMTLPSYTASSRVPPPPRQVAAGAPSMAPIPAASLSPQMAPVAQPSAKGPTSVAAAQPGVPGDRNALLSPSPLPNGQPYTTANAEAFIEARRRARFGQ